MTFLAPCVFCSGGRHHCCTVAIDVGATTAAPCPEQLNLADSLSFELGIKIFTKLLRYEELFLQNT